jgi:class 3 adenylate cyclase/HAMP domain-containing protein
MMRQVEHTDPAPDHADPATLRRGRAGGLLRRTFIIALVLVSGGLITSSAVELFFRYRESVEGIWSLQREVARGAAFETQQFVRDIEHTLWTATQTPDIVVAGLTEAYRFQLDKLLKVTPAITTAVALDATGRERLKVSRRQIVQPADLADRSQDAAFVHARAGKVFFSPVYFGPEAEPYMRLAVPIEPFPGDVVGVLSAEVRLTYIRDVIAQVAVGQAGYAYAVSGEGDLIAHHDLSLVLQKRNLKHLRQVQMALDGAPGPFVALPNLAGQQVFATYAPIPSLGWAVLVERPASEAYAPLYGSMLRTIVLLLFGLGMAVLASLLISRRVVRPMAVLQRGAARIGAGELEHRIDVRTGDELETLAVEFNRMAAHLQKSYVSLEQQVEERTRELAQAVAELQALGEVSRAVSSTLDLETVLSTIITHAVQLSGAQGGVLYEYDEATQTFHLRATHGTKQELVDTLQAVPIRLGEGAVGGAAAMHAPVAIPDCLDEQAVVLPQVRSLMIRLGYRSLLAVPLLFEKQIFGGLVVYRSEAGPFPTPSVQLLQTFATQSVLALQNARHFREVTAWNRTLEQRVAEQLTALEGMDRMKRFFSPRLAELLVSSGSEQLLESHRREVTVVFCDLRGFSAFAETAAPEEVKEILHQYHTAMGELIFRFEGTLERFTGDGLMVFFNDPLPCPDPAARAVRMAVGMRQRMRELTETWRQRMHQLDFGVGIAQGYATLGMIGFEGRVDYAAIGPVTNLAARLCDQALGGQILISQRVFAEVQALVHADPQGELVFKGFRQPMPVFNVVELKESDAEPNL